MLSSFILFSSLVSQTVLNPPNDIEHVNSWVNTIDYRADPTNQWQRLETFLTNGGDCEDYALAKLKILVSNGYSPSEFRLALVRDTYRRHHAVLLHKDSEADISKSLVLDSNTDVITTVAQRADLQPILSFTPDYVYVHGEGWNTNKRFPMSSESSHIQALLYAFTPNASNTRFRTTFRF